MDAPDPSATPTPATHPRWSGRPVPDGPLDRETAIAVLARADALLAAGEYQQAAAHYQRVVGFDDPGVTGAALLGLGEALYRLDQDAAALQAWESVLQVGESAATYQAWRRVAEARVRAGDLRGAIDAYRQAERRAPLDDRPYIASRLGWLSKELGDRGASRRYFARSRGDAVVSAATLTIGVTVAVSLIASFTPGNSLESLLALDKVAVARGEWWRLLSVTLLHAGVLHLFFNMYALYLAGPIVERMYGARWFVVLYVLCALGGSVASFAFGSGRLAVGASGAIFGLFGLLVSSDRTHRPILDLHSRSIVAQMGSLILINLVIGFVVPGIDWLAHLGGLLTGAWLGFVVRPGNVQTLAGMWQQTGQAETAAQRVGVPIAGIALLLILLWAGLLAGEPRWTGPRTPGAPSNGGTVSVTVAAVGRATGMTRALAAVATQASRAS